MAVVSAFDNLVAGVRKVLRDEGVTAEVLVGQREIGKQVNQGPGRANRVVLAWTGSEGAPPRYPGRNPRPIMTRLDALEVHVWAFDGAAANDEQRQQAAVSELLDWVLLAIRRTAHGTFAWKGGKLTVKPVERAFGKEVVFELDLQHSVQEVAEDEAAGGTLTPAWTSSMGLPGGDIAACGG